MFALGYERRVAKVSNPAKLNEVRPSNPISGLKLPV
jgi:hypothetical protein